MNKRRFPMVAVLITALSTGGTIVMGEQGNRLANLKQPPLNTTMMGVLKGVADCHGLGLSEPMIYGLSGHAFLSNKKMDPEEKIRLLKETKQLEAAAIGKVEKLAAALRAPHHP